MNDPADRELDVVVFGATGFVGRLVAGYLAGHAPDGVRIGLAGRSEERRARHVERDQAEAPRGRDHSLQHGTMDGGITHHPARHLPSAGLELWLHERDDPAAGREAARHGPKHQPERDERDVDDRERRLLAERRELQVARVHAVMDDHPRIAGE